MSERTRHAYDSWAAAYDTDANPQTALEYHAVLGALAAAPGDDILDAGCGTGRYSLACLQVGAQVTGVDFSRAMLRRASRKAPRASLIHADLAGRLPFVDGAFDKVICAQVLKHLPTVEASIQEFFRVLRPDGRLVFSVTHPDMDWQGYAMRTNPAFVLSAEADIHHHSWGDYEAALLSAGFHHVESRPVRISDTIADLLTEESLAVVVGRPQILLCTARKGA